ncbi:MAG: universal stress protein [Balneolaceae bacterium]
MNIQKILVPTDFSEGAEKVYPIAEKIASAFGAAVDFIHVIPTVKYLSESAKKLGLPLDMEKDLYPEIIKESEKRLEKAMGAYLAEENRGKFFVKIDRNISETITEHAAEGAYDLIIMGTRGGHNTGLWRGSTTEKVIRTSHVPVFSTDERMDENSIRNILVPTDSSTLSYTAIPFALQLAKTFGARIILYHVLELYGSISESIPRDPDKGEILSIYEVIIRRLESFLSEFEPGTVELKRTDTPFEDELILKNGNGEKVIPMHTVVEKGVSAHFEIEHFSSSEADLIVMATHGYSGLARLFLGSTAEKVVQYVEKPVLTIRPAKKHFQEDKTST